MDGIEPIITAPFDIETYSLADGSCPDPLSTANKFQILQIATTFQKYGETISLHGRHGAGAKP
eukprot:9472388-Pyramimonas_sp.AAC.3